MIAPTIGRIVLFTPSGFAMRTQLAQPFFHFDTSKPLAAIVAHVWNDRLVNLAVFDSNGQHHSMTSVPLLQDGDAVPSNGYFAEWMPYQKGQAAKTEAAEAALAAK